MVVNNIVICVMSCISTGYSNGGSTSCKLGAIVEAVRPKVPITKVLVMIIIFVFVVNIIFFFVYANFFAFIFTFFRLRREPLRTEQ